MNAKTKDFLIYAGFVAATVLATVPLWRPLAFGIDPTFDQLLQLSICGDPLSVL
jgi:hypothetical protein